MTELVQATIKRNFLYKSADYVWLLALLSSSTICTVHLYSVLPQIIDFLYLAVSDEIAHANEVCYFSLFYATRLQNSTCLLSHFRLQHPYVY